MSVTGGPGVAATMLNGRYFLTDNIRRGAQASVTQAFDTQANQMVAVKRVPFGPNDARAREAFQREARVLQTLRHDNIVEMIEIDHDDEGNWFIVLEWIDDNLEDILRRNGPMLWIEFWDRVGEPILDALSLAQKRQIAHRDIKPKNILVMADGTAKLADYGIAKLLDNAGAWAQVPGVTFRFDYTPADAGYHGECCRAASWCSGEPRFGLADAGAERAAGAASSGGSGGICIVVDWPGYGMLAGRRAYPARCRIALGA